MLDKAGHNLPETLVRHLGMAREHSLGDRVFVQIAHSLRLLYVVFCCGDSIGPQKIKKNRKSGNLFFTE
jgi:hypothetical protein